MVHMLPDRAQPTDPAMKIPSASSRVRRRPQVSQSLPNTGVEAVPAMRYAVTIQWPWSGWPRSRAMVGSAGATMVWLSVPTSMASSTPMTMMRMSRSDSTPGAGAALVKPGPGRTPWPRR